MPKFRLQVLGSFQTEYNNKAMIGKKLQATFKIAAFSPIARFWHKSSMFCSSRTEKTECFWDSKLGFYSGRSNWECTF